jgi:hypothetical protein
MTMLRSASFDKHLSQSRFGMYGRAISWESQLFGLLTTEEERRR